MSKNNYTGLHNREIFLNSYISSLLSQGTFSGKKFAETLGKTSRYAMTAGNGFYIGFMDASNTPVYATTKIISMSSPVLILTGATTLISQAIKKMNSLVAENPPLLKDLETRMTSKGFSNFEESVASKFIQKKTKSALIHSSKELFLGYCAGYTVAKLIDT